MGRALLSIRNVLRLCLYSDVTSAGEVGDAARNDAAVVGFRRSFDIWDEVTTASNL